MPTATVGLVDGSVTIPAIDEHLFGSLARALGPAPYPQAIDSWVPDVPLGVSPVGGTRQPFQPDVLRAWVRWA